MSEITAEMVKKLREMTGAGMMDCKSALKEANGSFDAAVDVLRKKGLKDVAKRAGKVAAEGAVGVYVHPGDQIVAIVELNCETDFVARGAEFKEMAREIAMQVAAMKPLYLNREEVPASAIERETNVLVEQLTEAQKKNQDKILVGKLDKFYQDVCLLDQLYVKDDKVKISTLIEQLSSKCGEKVIIRRFQRMEVGEGVEKSETNLLADVAEVISQSV